MRTNYVMIDYENVPVKALDLLKAEHFRVRVFLGPKNTKLPVEFVLAMQELGNRAEYILLEAAGTNALDFHIAYYLGILSASDPEGFFHIISKDTGFDPLIQHLKSRKVSCVRSPSIEQMPCFALATVGEAPSTSVPNEGRLKACNGQRSVEELVKIAVEDLKKRKASKPRTPQTLRSTIHAKCGKNVPATDIDAVYGAMVKRGYIKVNGTKVTYALPEA